MSVRPIKMQSQATPTMEGPVFISTAFWLRRYRSVRSVPDDGRFPNDNPSEYLKGFPWHPHRGIETITYVLKGNVEHGDCLATAACSATVTFSG